MTKVNSVLTPREITTHTEKEMSYDDRSSSYFEEGYGSTTDKLRNFPKYISRQASTLFLAKYELFKKVLNVHGSIVEGGVFLGGGLMSWAHFSTALEPVNFTRHIIGFDTFSGFPDLSPNDISSNNPTTAQAGGFNAESYDDLKECISLYDLNRSIGHIPKVRLVKGDATVTIPEFVRENQHLIVSLLYLDFDIYAPTKCAIEYLWDRVPVGGIVAFDEAGHEHWPGETMAIMDTVGVKSIKLQRIEWCPNISYVVKEG